MPKDRPDLEPENYDPDAIIEPEQTDLMKKLSEAEEKSNQYWERIQRMQADADNATRRAERDVQNAHKYALEKFVNDLLPIVDSLELCTRSIPKDLQKTAESIVDGVELTLKMFYASLEKFGVKQVNPVGEMFDPEFQQAISMQEDDDLVPGTVVSVLQKGYTLNSRLIRPALVVVAKAKE